MTSYRFTGAYTRFYPQVQDAEGKSLMAEPGMVTDFDAGPPDDGNWIPVKDAPEATPPEVPLAAPEVSQEAPEMEPAPVIAPPAPETAPAITEPAVPEPVLVGPVEPAPVQEPEPEPVPPAEFPASATLPSPGVPPRLGYISPYART